MGSRRKSQKRGKEVSGIQDMWSGAKTLVFSSNFTMGPLFSRGVLLAPGAGESTEVAFFDSAGDRLLHRATQIPASWVADASMSVRNLVPLAIELHRGVSVRRAPLSVEYVLLEDVEALVFRDERERDRVLSATFGDFSLKALSIEARIDADAFVAPAETLSPVVSKPDDAHRLRLADAAAGLYFAYFARCGGQEQVVAPRATSAGARGRLRKVFEGLEDANEPYTTLDDLLSSIAGRVLVRYPTRMGWPSREVLESLKSEAASALVSAGDNAERLRGELARWHERAVAVLEEKGPEPQLADDPHLCARALMLLLLRGGDPDELKGNPGAGALVIGKEVALLALALAGLRSGLRALPSELKVDPAKGLTRSWLEFGARCFVNWFAGRPLSRLDLQIEYRRAGTLQGEWLFKDGGNLLMSRVAEFDADLVRVHSIGRSLGFEFDEADGEALSTRTGESQRAVKLSIIGDGGDSRIVRFCTLLQEVPKKKPAKVTARGVGLSADDLLEMLLTNADRTVNCRIGIDRESGVPTVLADQLMATLDVQEFRRHLIHVAEVADRWAAQHPPTRRKPRKAVKAASVGGAST